MKIKKDVEPVATDNPLYDLFEGGYIKPCEILEDSSEVDAAVKIVNEFLTLLEDEGILEVM